MGVVSAPSNTERSGSGVLGAQPEPVTGLESGAAAAGTGHTGRMTGADAGPWTGVDTDEDESGTDAGPWTGVNAEPMAGAGRGKVTVSVPDRVPDAPLGPQPQPSPDLGVPVPPVGRRARLLVGWMVHVAVVLSIVVGLVLLVPRPNAVPLQVVDVAGAARAASPELGFEPSVPSGPVGWTATVAVVRHGTDDILTWHVGFVTPKGTFAGIDQATRSNYTWENALDSGGMWVGTVKINGHAWVQVEKAERGTTTLILRRPGRVTLVTAKGGGVPDAVTLIRSLPPGTLS